MDLNKHIVRNDNESEKPFHSHGFAEVANSNRVGSVGKVSFEQRIQMENNRQLVGGYHRSALGNSYGALRAKSVAPGASGRGNASQRPSLQQRNVSSGVRRFSEPTVKKYNPYA